MSSNEIHIQTTVVAGDPDDSLQILLMLVTNFDTILTKCFISSYVEDIKLKIAVMRPIPFVAGLRIFYLGMIPSLSSHALSSYTSYR